MATFSTTVWKEQSNRGVSIYNQIGSSYDDTGSKSIVLVGRGERGMDGGSPERQGPPQLLTPWGALWRLVALPVRPREEQRSSRLTWVFWPLGGDEGGNRGAHLIVEMRKEWAKKYKWDL